MLRACAVILMLLLFPSLSAADNKELTIGADKSNYNVGDTIIITIEAEGKDFKPGEIDEENLKPFEISSKEEIFDEESDKTSFVIKASLFETGNHQFPELTFFSGNGKKIKSPPLSISIIPLLKGDEKEIRDLKPQAELKERGPLWPWALLALSVAAIALLVFYLLKRKKDQTFEALIDSTPPHIKALEEIARIEKMGLLREGRIKEFYTLLSDALRNYEGERYGFDSMEMTTCETINSLKRKKTLHVDEIEKFLNSCDMVKFAKYAPPLMDIEALAAKARGVIEKDFQSDIEAGADENYVQKPGTTTREENNV